MNSNKITTKAETLVFLSKNNFPVPKSYFFTVKEWEFDEKSILDKIIKQFKEYKFIAIRSSSLLEDSESNSMAGFFESFLNVDLGNKVHIKKLINKVISSYKYDELNQVLIQNMINNVKLSGVLMTKVHDDGSPYYVINFDDTTQNTDSVTSGNSINKTVYIYNGYKEEHFDNEYLLEVLKVVKNLEKTYFKTPLDIEFAVDENKEVIIFQVRPITTSNKWTKEASDLIPKRLPYLENFIGELMLRRTEIYGETSLLGIMPDWNPAEMIGTVPNPLAFSLYRELITKSTWRISREKMGYKELPNLELLVSLFGRPERDVRNSINSFLPKGLSPKISEKLVNRYIKKLDSNPQLHDKIEFEVVFTVFEFNFKELFKRGTQIF